MEIAALGNEQFILGFNLAGVRKGIVVTKDANKEFEQLMGDPSVGIVVIHKETFDMLSERNKEAALTRVKPIVVALSHDLGGEDNLRIMIKRSLGVDLWK